MNIDFKALEKERNRFARCRDILKNEKLSPEMERQLFTKIIEWGDAYRYWKLFEKVFHFQTVSVPILEAILASKRLCLYCLALHCFYLPSGFRRRLLEGVYESKNRYATRAAMIVLLTSQDRLSKAWVSKLRNKTHSLWRATPEARKVIEAFFGENYVVMAGIGVIAWEWRRYWPGLGYCYFRMRDQTPVFPNYWWEVVERRERGEFAEALLASRFIGGRVREKVILLKDKNDAYAYLVPPPAQTLNEALALFYGLDPEEFEGFDVEA